MGNFTPTTNAAAIPTVISNEVLNLLPGYLNLAKTVRRDFSDEIANYGDTVKVTKTGGLVAKQKTPGAKIETQNPNTDDLDVKLDQHWYVSFLQEDITAMLQKPDLQQKYAADAAITLAEKIEVFLASLHSKIQNTVTFDTTSASTMEKSFLRLRAFFNRNKVPLLTTKYAYLDTDVVTELLMIDRFTKADAVGEGSAIIQGALRKIHSINIFESQMVQTSGSPVVRHNLAYTENGMALVTRPMPLDGNGKGAVQYTLEAPDTGVSMRVTESYDTDYLGMKMTMDVLFGGDILDQRHIVEFESK